MTRKVHAWAPVAGLVGSVMLLFTAALSAQSTGVPWTGAPGITETVSQIMERQRLTAPIPAGQVIALEEPEIDFTKLPRNPNPTAPSVSQWPPAGDHQGSPLPFNPQTVGTSFAGTHLSESNFVPPDSIGAIGPTQVLVPSNGRIKVFDRNGTLGALNVTSNVFFSSVRNGSSTSDPRVRYDRLSGRWFLTMINVSTPNRVLIAVSSGSTITDTSSFTFFQFQQDLVGTVPNSDTGDFADYDTLGVDANALYIGVNIFNSTLTAFVNTTGFVVKKSDLLTSTLTVTAFRQLINGSFTGMITPQGVTNDDPSATEGYFIGVDASAFSKLDMRRISTPGGVPTISGNIVVGGSIPATDFPMDQPALGSANPLDAIDDRLYAAAIHKVKDTGVSTLWAAHNIGVNSSGVASSADRNGSRWYQIGSLTTSPTLIQAGTVFDSAGSNPMGYWMPSIAMSGQGHAAFGSSRAGNNEHAEIAVAGRLVGDPLGTLQAPTLAQSSSTTYNVQGTTQRWGDYSVVNVDPNDDMTMWTFQEYCDVTDDWAVRAIELLAPPPAKPASCSPPSIAQGTSGNIVVTGTPSSGSGFFDPDVAFLNHISAAVNGGGVTVNTVTYTDPTHATLNVTVSPAAALGARTVTVTNPDAQSSTSASGILTITTGVTITNINPNSGSSLGGRPVVITGTLLDGATSVTFGGNAAAITGDSPTQVHVTTPAHALGSVDVVFIGTHGTATATNGYTYVPPPNRVFASARTGNDANDCASILTPCQTFAGAVAQVAPGGEVIVLDSGGYGPMTITKGVTVEAPPGVLAFIHPPSGDAVTINAGSTDTVILRGLVINGGSGNGIAANTLGALHVENCVVSGFATGMSLTANGQIFLKDTIVRACSVTGINMHVSSGTILASIDRCRLENNGTGLTAGNGALVSIRRSVASGNASGLVGNGTGAQLDIDACLVANNGTVGIAAGAAATTVRVSRSTVTDNGIGLEQSGSGTFLSRTDNTVEGNATPTSGTIGSFTEK